MLLLSERSLAGEREDAIIRASCLARAAWLRVLEARQDIAALLYTGERDGDILLEARMLPWTRARAQLYYGASEEDMRVLPPGGYTNGQPFWRLPGRLAAGYSFFLTTDEGRARGDRLLPGINGILRKDAAEEFHAAARDTSWDKTDFAASQRFFARQRLFDKLRAEFAALRDITRRDFADVSLLVISDNTPVYNAGDGLSAGLSPQDIRLLSFYASRETSLARAFPMDEKRVRAICGYDQDSGLVVVDLQYTRALPPLELGLFLVSVFIPFAAVFVFTQSRGIEKKYVFLILLAFSLAAGIVLIHEAADDYGHRSNEAEIFRKDFAACHLEGEHPIRQAHAALFRDFALAELVDMNRSPGQGKLGIYSITIGTQALTLFGIHALSVLFGASAFGHHGRPRIWGRAAIVLLGAGTLLALFGAIFLASSEHQAVSADSGIADLAMTMAMGLLLLLGQIIIAFPLSVLLSALNRGVRGALLAILFLPFFVSPVLYEFITRFIVVSEQARPALWYGLRFFAVLPVTILGFVYAARQIPPHNRDDSDVRDVRDNRDVSTPPRFAGVWAFFRSARFTLPIRFLAALPVFVFSYYLLLEPWPGRLQPGPEAASLTQLAQAGHSMPFSILFVTILLFVIFLRSARQFSQGKDARR